MSTKEIQIGQRFGHLTVLERNYDNTKNAEWLCLCDCGTKVKKVAQGLRSGQSTCCDPYHCKYRKLRGRDLTNQRFGRLVALYPTDKRSNKSIVWMCQCDCGKQVEVSAKSLTTNVTKSCGCLKQETDRQPKGNVKDEIGNKYGHLTVIARAGSNNAGQAQWECECDCEVRTHLIVLGSNLRRGHTRSCGCDRRSHGELEIEQLLRNNNIPFVQEYRAFQFSSGGYASFDFYVNNSYIIEYDGETHYMANLHGWHDQQQLKAQQERDIIKNQWCKERNIPLIRIPYTHLKELKIEDLLLETTQFLIS